MEDRQGDDPYPQEKDYTADDLVRFWKSQGENETFWAGIDLWRLPGTLFLVRNLSFRSRSIRDILGESNA